MHTVDWSRVKAIAFDFDGVFTDDRVWVSQTGEESVACSRSDGMGIGLLRQAGVQMIIISKEPNPVVSARARKLALEVIQGCDNKLPEFSRWLKRIGVSVDHSAFMGNDINDLECMQHAAVAIAPADAHPAALAVADYITQKPGGNGAIREVADVLGAALLVQRSAIPS
jgi:N-acylneuraminate cytidylyltransferase